MFTGIIEELGVVDSIGAGRLAIRASKVLEDVSLGDSIAVNGVCLTVVEFDDRSFSADVMNETMSRTSLGALTVGSPVDLERAMSSQGRFGGHIVSGHIDGTGTIKGIKQDGNAVWFEIKTTDKILDGIVEKGSITIDGISLTVADVDNTSFKVSIIPHTLEATVLGTKRIGNIVNLENDVVGKYVKKFLDSDKSSRGLTKETLFANGFL